MRRLAAAVCCGLILIGSQFCAAADAICLYPDNPHYLLFRGKPVILVGSTEHYGAVLNTDFNYLAYLDEVQSKGLNLTRTFSGFYCEDDKAFNIAHNTLAPAAGKLICPWARSDVNGYANGGNKFDLTKFDPRYFARLRDFVAEAAKRGIVVELVLFCPFYRDSMWDLCPLKESNNINGLGKVQRTEVNTLASDVLPVQLEMVRKIVTELRDFDNVYYEICKEPYFGGVTLDW